MAPSSRPTPMTLSKNQINKAGKFLRDVDQAAEKPGYDWDNVSEALDIVQTFRDAHAYPMQKVRNGLDSFVRTTRVSGAATQRHKRVARILRKLRRMRDGASGGTSLARLEDIGGCRVVVETAADMRRLAAHIERRWSNSFARDPRDYVSEPKPMGYRAIHYVVVRDGRAIEVQLRTRGQQQWSQAVEGLDATLSRRTDLTVSLKDEIGPPDLLNYFRMAGDLIYRRENRIEVPQNFLDAFDEAQSAVLAAGYYTR